MDKLLKLGFKGDLRWVHNEEGSGAKFYGRSVYYPDSIVFPQTESGITIDPGFDLGNGSRKIANEVINFYRSQDLLTNIQVSYLNEAIGLKKLSAINWLKNYKSAFKNKFLVPDKTALDILDKYTAPHYWKPLSEYVPGLLKIRSEYIKSAVHTALLSMAYNRGWQKTAKLAKEFVEVNNWDGLAKKIHSIKHRTESLNERREREGNLILAALEFKQDFVIIVDEKINPRPCTTLPQDQIDTLIQQMIKDRFINDLKKVAKPEVNV